MGQPTAPARQGLILAALTGVATLAKMGLSAQQEPG